MSKTMVVVPTYNEIDNIQRLIEALFALSIPDLEVLIVDDNSPDGTGQVVDTLVARDPRLHVMHRAGKQGLGTAYIQGFQWALSEGADVIIQMDADFSHAPAVIPALLDTLPGYDAVIGSRYVKGARLDERWGIGRKLLSWWANAIWVRTILQIPIHDATGGFRAWKRDTLIGMNIGQVRSNGYIFQVEMTYVAHRLGYHFAEIPIYFEDRRYGTSKMSFDVQAEAAIGVFKLRQRYRNLIPAMRRASL